MNQYSHVLRQVDAPDAISHKIRSVATHWLLDEIKQWKSDEFHGHKNPRRRAAIKHLDMAHDILRGKTMSAVAHEQGISRSNLRNNLLQVLLWIEYYKKLSDLGRL
jgi:hypothetical protein